MRASRALIAIAASAVVAIGCRILVDGATSGADASSSAEAGALVARMDAYARDDAGGGDPERDAIPGKARDRHVARSRVSRGGVSETLYSVTLDPRWALGGCPRLAAAGRRADGSRAAWCDVVLMPSERAGQATVARFLYRVAGEAPTRPGKVATVGER